MKLRAYKTVTDRRKALEKECGVELPHIGASSLDESIASKRNCENMIGVSQVPMGIAGPLRMDGREYYVPIATTEGALVASVSRGCKAISESGGAIVDTYHVGATRGPVFRVRDLSESKALAAFLHDKLSTLQDIAQKTSRHLQLKSYFTSAAGKYRYVRFAFDTQDAMGMNMVTIATQAIVEYVEQQTGITCLAVAGNFDIDKKPSWLNIIEKRGTKVWAEVTVPASVLRATLKTTAKRVYDVWLAKCMIGSALSGSLGFNAQYANIIAGIFLATGQDLGHVGEASVGITTAEISGTDDLYIQACLPDVMAGIVGGGTGLATQKEALRIIGAKSKDEFVRVIAAAVLAGELSLLSSLASGSLAQAHQVLARGKST